MQEKTESIRDMQRKVVLGMANMIENRDGNTGGHVKRTSDIIQILVDEIMANSHIKLDGVLARDIVRAAPMHDLGKISIDESVLNKPTQLTEEEFEVMKTHSATSGEMVMILLDGVEEEHFVKTAFNVARYHHERWDGKGYPTCLAGEAVPILSRIISIVDSYDAMVNDRSYRKAITVEEAKAELVRCAGSQFDPHLTEEFLAMLDEMPEIARGETEEEPTPGSNIVIPTMGLAPDPHGTQSLDHEAKGHSTDNGPSEVAFSRYIMDLDDYILSTDSDFEEITGYTEEDINDGWLTQKDLIPEAQRHEYFSAVAEQLSEGDVVYMEHEIVRKDGRHVYVLCFAKRHYDSASKTIRTEVTIVDSSTIKAFNKKAGGKA